MLKNIIIIGAAFAAGAGAKIVVGDLLPTATAGQGVQVQFSLSGDLDAKQRDACALSLAAEAVCPAVNAREGLEGKYVCNADHVQHLGIARKADSPSGWGWQAQINMYRLVVPAAGDEQVFVDQRAAIEAAKAEQQAPVETKP
jgi:hypothetical protein